ncbi:hypothetical protein [Micromonospora antibiotica]|uniref:Response regulatory domain-containing protein n=1 Tax=Micromonospora antibiotica TaxID=2807623 RepID=A0ABS3V7Z0_9ACTN|nr:hypothetical protein [Micromonospora antibiotica]MBO4161715.1 hypothetical protein [Micromonospora antibiotica]
MTKPLPANFDGAREPLVIIIDDEDQDDFAELIRDQGVEAVSLKPDDLEPELLNRATTLVLDQYLDTWPGRDQHGLPLALSVPDGLALSAVLRSHVEGIRSDTQSRPAPVAIMLRTGELDRLGVGLPKAAREYLLARQYNLEWVFNKGEEPLPNMPSPARRVAAVARATSTLPANWGPGSQDPGLHWLALPDVAWAEDARWQIEQCRPPQHVVAERTAGLAWLRWFLQRILPFPTFLLDRTHLAVTLGLDMASIEDVLSSESPLAVRLDELRYGGPLGEFLGERWWRAGLSHLVEQLLEANPENGSDHIQAIAAAAAASHGRPLKAIKVEDPVVGVKADYSSLSVPLSAASAVRLQPDDWPPYADDAWAARDVLTGEYVDPELLALVVSTDRWRIHQDDSGAPNEGQYSPPIHEETLPTKAIRPEGGTCQR